MKIIRTCREIAVFHPDLGVSRFAIDDHGDRRGCVDVDGDVVPRPRTAAGPVLDGDLDRFMEAYLLKAAEDRKAH